MSYSKQQERVFELAQQEPYWLGDSDADMVVEILKEDQRQDGNSCEMCGEPIDEDDRREWTDDEGTEILYCECCFDRMEGRKIKTYRFRYETLYDVDCVSGELVKDISEIKIYHNADGLRKVADFNSRLDLQTLTDKIKETCVDCHIITETLQLKENYTGKR
jgi:hypothetical protein